MSIQSPSLEIPLRGGKLLLRSFVRRALRRAPSPSPWDNHEPIREELFGPERLDEHARSLALAQRVTAKPARGHPLAGRLADNAAVLLAAYRNIARTIEDGHAITPAAEWLIDNYHLVERQIREIRSDLPSGYYRQLPKLADGPFAGYPRVFGLAWAFVAHTDSRFDPEMLCRFVRAYQEVQPLTIGELWAVAITLRIVLVENLRRLAERIVHSRIARQEADDIADRLLGAAGRTAEPVPAVLAAHRRAALPDAFAVQLIHRLRDQDPSIVPALNWLDDRLAAQGTTAEAVVRDEHQRQGAANVTVRNIITSMRLISDVDWTELFERISLVDDVLAAGGAFRGMDFATRNLYRSAIEELARGSKPDRDRDCAQRRPGRRAGRRRRRRGAEAAARDPGYHLLAGGRHAFEQSIGFRAPAARLDRALDQFGRHRRLCGRRRRGRSGAPRPAPGRRGRGLGGGWLALLAAFGAIPAIDAAVALVNRGDDARFRCDACCRRLELRDGIPAHLRTLVAVPTMLTTHEAIEEQIERLEIHHLASPEGDLHFALLSDWVDAATEQREGDAALLAAAADGIARLNTALRSGAGRRTAFCCSTAGGSGTPARRAGSAGSASAASCMS